MLEDTLAFFQGIPMYIRIGFVVCVALLIAVNVGGRRTIK
jgi:hypothetical protein